MDIKYLAGLFDGEGSVTIYLHNGKYILTTQIVNSHKGVIIQSNKLLNGSITHDKGKGTSTSTWRLRLSLTDSKNFFNSVIPYLIVKKEQCQIGLDFLTNRENGFTYREMIREARNDFVTESNTLSLEYIAGFLDAEGSITITKRIRKDRPSPLYAIDIRIVNNHIGVLKSIQKKYGGFIHIRKEDKGNQLYDLIMNNQHGKDLLNDIYPYLIIKKEEAELALKFPLSESRQPLTKEQIKQKDEIRNKIISLHGSKY